MILVLRNLISQKLYDINERDQSLRACWVRYHVEVFLVSITKHLVIILCAIVLESLKEMAVTYFSFGLIRTYAKGWHALSNWYCSLETVFFFSVLPALTKGITLPNGGKGLIGLLALTTIAIYAPQATEKNPINDLTYYKKLKLMSIYMACVLFVIQYIVPEKSSICVSLALMTQVLMVLPFTKKIVEGRKQHYEHDQEGIEEKHGEES